MSAVSDVKQTAQPPQPTPGKPIPLPPDFPVQWEDPADARLNWTFDPVHFPDPMSPLAFDLHSDWARGGSKAFEHYDLPMRWEVRRLNTYFYQTFAPKGLPPEPVLKAMQALGRLAPGAVNALQGKAANAMASKLLEHITPYMARLEAYWAQELLPEIQTMLSTWERFDLRGATLPQLLAHLDQTLSMGMRVGEIHHLISLPYLLAMSEFDELYHDLFRSNGAADDPFGAYRLLEGFDNKILEGDRALWRLSRQALTLPVVRQVLEERAASEVMAELQKSAEGQAFLTALSNFLQTYGQRSDKFDTVGTPSWIEDPTPVLKMLKDQLTQPDRDLEVELKALAAEREQHVAEARARLKGYPRPVVERFETLLKAAQYATFLHSEHQFWLDFGCAHQVRRVMQEFGRRFAEAGVMDEPNDVFYLHLDELKETAQALSRDASHLKALMRERKAEMEHFRQVQPPASVGAPPPDAPPMDNAMGRLRIKFGDAPLPVAAEPGALRGNAGSPGKVCGRAKVMRSLAEADKLQHGDILVAEATAPPWTPLFATAAAIVTDAGGVLSHSAVVAREYRIPAVVGTGKATTTFHDGQLLEVDGDAGIVRLVSEN